MLHFSDVSQAVSSEMAHEQTEEIARFLSDFHPNPHATSVFAFAPLLLLPPSSDCGRSH